MKKLTYVTILIFTFMTGTLVAQTYPSLRFRKPTTTDNITWKFTSVAPGVNAFITVVRTKNASLDEIDDSTKYAYAWNPYIKYTNTPANASDSSFVEFKVEFKKANGTAQTLSNMAMTVIDCDGGLNGLNIYREMVKTTLPATSKGLLGTLLTAITGTSWLTNIAGPNDYSSIDTNNFLAMSQINYSNVSSYNLKVGVLGRIAGGTSRQASFYFKNFAPLTLTLLPVKMIDFKAYSVNKQNTVNWSTTSEENSNRFEIYRSLDGKSYTLAGTVQAAGYSQSVNNYSFVDQQVSENNASVFYKLKVVGNDETAAWSSIVNINNTMDKSKTTLNAAYPNPTKGILNISLNGAEDSEFTVDIMDVFGKAVQSHTSSDFNAGSLSLDLTALSNGVYFIKVNNQDGSSNSSKFIKN